MHSSHCHTKWLQTSPLNGHITPAEALCFLFRSFHDLFGWFLGSGSSSGIVIYIRYAVVLIASFISTVAGKNEQRPTVCTVQGVSSVWAIQQSCLSSDLCRKLKAYLLVSSRVASFWSGILQETVRFERMAFSSTLFFSLLHTCSPPTPFSGSALLPSLLLCVDG